jgi:hypothetical protein
MTADPVAKLAVPPLEAGQRRYAMVLALVAAGLLVGVVALNVAANPRGEFGGTRYRPLVLDQGLLKLRALDAAPPPEWVILGSSRVLVMPPQALPWVQGRPAFNLGIAGSQPADYELLARYLEQADPALKGVVWGIDSFAISQGNDPILSLSGAYARLGGPSASLGHLAEMAAKSLSSAYVRDSLKVLQYTYLTGYPVGAEEFGPDGTATEVASEASIAAGTFDLKAALDRHFERVVAQRFSPERAVAPEAEATLERTLTNLTRHGVAVKAFLPPIHPQGIERLRDNPRYVLFQQETLALLLRHCGPLVQVFDFTPIASFNGTADGFYDNYHLRPDNAVRLAAALGDSGKDLCPVAHG